MDRRYVVLDGSNGIYNGDKKVDISRLKIIIDRIKQEGRYELVPCLDKGTVYKVKRKPNLLIQDSRELEEFLEKEGIRLVKNDIEIIDLAVKLDAILLTKDSFKDTKKDGKVIQRERSLHPDRNWDDIDKRTLRFKITDGKFICPELLKPISKKPRLAELETKNAQLIEQILGLKEMNTELKDRLERRENQNKTAVEKQIPARPTYQQEEMPHLERIRRNVQNGRNVRVALSSLSWSPNNQVRVSISLTSVKD